MTGNQKAQQLKKQNGQPSRFTLMKSNKQREQRPVSQQSQQQQQQHYQQQEQSSVINVDELASKKVQEVEQSLEDKSASDFKLDTFTAWFSVLKQIITAADLHRTNDKNDKSTSDGQEGSKHETGDSIYADYSDDNEHFTAHVDLSEQFATNSVKWTIRVRAFKIVHRLVLLVINNNNSTPSTSASSQVSYNLSSVPQAPSKILIKHLPDLVRLSFVAATSPYDELKMQGFEMFRVLIDKFASFEETEFPGHSILEQYKTQVLSAVKPAFNLDAPPYITAIASQICSLWICRGLEKNLTDVKRTYQLMLLSIEKLEGQSVNQHSKLYTESELEQERVDILGSWAQLYIASEESKLSEQYGRLSRLSRAECDNLNHLVKSQIEQLVDKWWEAMKDYALLIMPAPKFIGTSHDNEHVYTREVALRLFSPTWPKLVLALTIWLCKDGEDWQKSDSPNETTSFPINDSKSTTTNNLTTTTESTCDINEPVSPQKRASKAKYCKFLCGVIMKELSRCIINKIDTRAHLSDSTVLALRSINLLLTNTQMQHVFLDDLAIAQEFYGTLYSITVICGRDSARFILRNTLDLLFKLIVGKIRTKERNIHHGLAKLISSLMSTMKNMEIACNEKSSADLDTNRMHLSVRLQNLLTLIKSAPEYAMNEAPLQEALIAVFQEMLRFNLEPTVSVALADHLKDLYSSINDSCYRFHMIDQLFPELCSRVEELLGLFYSSDKHNDLDKLRLAQADTFLRAMRVAIDNLDSASRNNKIEQYVVATLKTLHATVDDKLDELISTEAKRRRELIDYCLSQVAILQKSYPDEFGNNSLDIKIRQRIDRITKLQKDIKLKLDSQNKKLQSAKKPGALGSQKPQVSKIALKADFSNFYAKKP